MKRQPTGWGKICANEVIDKGLVSKIHKQPMMLNSLKTAHSKMGRRPEQTFLQRGQTHGKQAHEKMFSITNYQINADQNHSEVSLHISQSDYHQTVHKQEVLQRAWREGNPLHCWWECKLVQPLGRIVQRFLKKQIELPYDPSVPLLGIYPEKIMV